MKNNIINQSHPQYVNDSKGILRPNVFLNLLLLALLVTIDFTPILSRIISPLLKLTIFLMWAISAYGLPSPRQVVYPKKYIYWWLMYPVWLFAMCAIGHSNVSINFFIIRIPLYGIPFMMLTVIGKYNMKEKELLWKVIFVVFLLNLIHNIILGFTNPDVFSLVDKLDASASEKMSNAGGTVFVFICMFSVSLWWIVNRNVFRKKDKIQSFVIIVLSLFYITIQNSRATALIVLLLMIIAFFLVSFQKKKHYSKKKWIFIMAILLTIGLSLLLSFLQIMQSIFENYGRMAERFADLAVFFEEKDLNALPEGSLAFRIMLWQTSVNTFFSSIPNFFFGIGENVHERDVYSLIRGGVGEHSEFFDLAARYGVVGIIIIYHALKNTFLYIKHLCLSANVSNMLNVIIFGFLVYSFFNGSLYEGYLYFMMLFLPLTLILLTKRYK